MKKADWLWAAVLALSACSDGTQSGSAIVALHDLDHLDEGDVFAVPFPNDVRIGSDGTVDLSLWPRLSGVVAPYLEIIDAQLRGAGTQSAVYFRFDGALDVTSLADASAFIVDVTPTSPSYDERAPVASHFVADSGDFIGSNWLALKPLDGFPLRERTTYAAILTDGLRASGGGSVRADAAFAEVLTGARVVAAYRPLTDWIAAHPALAAHIVGASVFTTVDATGSMKRFRDAVYATPAPTLASLTHDATLDQPGTYREYEGTYLAPNFQQGTAPYSSSGGSIVFDGNGVPQVAHTETMRVAMTIPDGPMPADGWPVVLYAHGTTGDFRSFLSDGSADLARVTDSTGAVISRMAVISIDQVLHGTRAPAGTDVEILFFNFQNMPAAHDNVKQGAVDDFQLLRLVRAIDVAAAPGTGQPIKFDPARIYFKGHSQGSLTGIPFVGSEPEVKAAIFSGAGAGLILTLLNKTEPVNIPQVVMALLHDPVDAFHPFLNLLQAHFEDVDAANYARAMFRDPPSGSSPKSVFLSLGVVDHYTPVPNIKALALALAVQPIGAQLEPIDYLDLLGLSWGSPPVSGNVAGGAATGVLCEYKPSSGDGHFVVETVAAAKQQSMRFLATHAQSQAAILLPAN